MCRTRKNAPKKYFHARAIFQKLAYKGATFCFPNVCYSSIMQVFPHLLPFLLPLIQITLTGSLFTILAVAMERFISISR